jgi:hypothetical protein
MTRKSSQRSSQITTGGGGSGSESGRDTRNGQRKTARKPVSSNRISQPYPQKICPMWQYDRYTAHSANIEIAFSSPAITSSESTSPNRARACCTASEAFQ